MYMNFIDNSTFFSADASSAPACFDASKNNIINLLDTVSIAVSIFVFRLSNILKNIIKLKESIIKSSFNCSVI